MRQQFSIKIQFIHLQPFLRGLSRTLSLRLEHGESSMGVKACKVKRTALNSCGPGPELDSETLLLLTMAIHRPLLQNTQRLKLNLTDSDCF